MVRTKANSKKAEDINFHCGVMTKNQQQKYPKQKNKKRSIQTKKSSATNKTNKSKTKQSGSQKNKH